VKAPRFAATVLAGGLSSRMKEFKPLLPLGDATIADYVIATFRGAGVDVFLGLGHRQEELKAGLKRRDITIIFNPGCLCDIMNEYVRLKRYQSPVTVN